jgi:hypothetical protein
MALINKEIRYNSPVEFIEHKTGKRVKSWKRLLDRMSVMIIFDDNTCVRLDEGGLIDNEIVFEPLPKSYCACCGEEAHIGYFDWAGRCDVFLKRIWGNARKLFWHRYIKNDHKLPL